MYEVTEGKLNAIEQPTVIFSCSDELKIPEIDDAKTNPPENHQDNRATLPVKTHHSPPHSPLEDTFVDSTTTTPCPRVEAGDATIKARMGDLPYVHLLGADYMIYGVYQDWVHQNPGDHLDGGIAEDSKCQTRLKNLFVCRTNAVTHLPGNSGRDLWESCL